MVTKEKETTAHFQNTTIAHLTKRLTPVNLEIRFNLI